MSKTLAELHEWDQTLVAGLKSAALGALMDPVNHDIALETVFKLGSNYFDTVFIELVTNHRDLRDSLEMIARQKSRTSPQLQKKQGTEEVIDAHSVNAMVQQELMIVLNRALEKDVPAREKFVELKALAAIGSIDRADDILATLGQHGVVASSRVELRDKKEELQGAVRRLGGADQNSHPRINPANEGGRGRGGERTSPKNPGADWAE